MTVVVLYFAALRDATRVSSEAVPLPDGIRTVADLLEHLGQRPEFEGKLGSVRVAINETFAAQDAVLTEGDTVALIPPVQGG